jgi:hypothetical protein
VNREWYSNITHLTIDFCAESVRTRNFDKKVKGSAARLRLP